MMQILQFQPNIGAVPTALFYVFELFQFDCNCDDYKSNALPANWIKNYDREEFVQLRIILFLIIKADMISSSILTADKD